MRRTRVEVASTKAPQSKKPRSQLDSQIFERIGEPGGTRTRDPLIKSFKVTLPLSPLDSILFGLSDFFRVRMAIPSIGCRPGVGQIVGQIAAL